MPYSTLHSVQRPTQYLAHSKSSICAFQLWSKIFLKNTSEKFLALSVYYKIWKNLAHKLVTSQMN